MSLHTSSPTLRWAVALALGLSLAACGKKEEAAAPAAPAATAQQAAAENAAAAAAKQQQAALAALSADELRTRGRQALREQRIYTPAGDNAMEYYIALRKKTEKPDPSAESALMDLQPYAVIAAEQAIGRKDYLEAERLRALIAAAEPTGTFAGAHRRRDRQGQAAAAQEEAAAATRTRTSWPPPKRRRRRPREDAKGRRPRQTRRPPPPRWRARAGAGKPPRPWRRRRAPRPRARNRRRRARPHRTCALRPGRARASVSRRRPGRDQHAAAGLSAGGAALRHQGPGGGFLHRQPGRQRRRRQHRQRQAARRCSSATCRRQVRRWRYQPIAGAQQVTRTFDFE
jgi:protein TonB